MVFYLYAGYSSSVFDDGDTILRLTFWQLGGWSRGSQGSGSGLAAVAASGLCGIGNKGRASSSTADRLSNYLEDVAKSKFIFDTYILLEASTLVREEMKKKMGAAQRTSPASTSRDRPKHLGGAKESASPDQGQAKIVGFEEVGLSCHLIGLALGQSSIETNTKKSRGGHKIAHNKKGPIQDRS